MEKLTYTVEEAADLLGGGTDEDVRTRAKGEVPSEPMTR